MIVGVGLISEELAPRCKAFGMNVVGVSSRVAAPNFDRMFARAQLKQAAALADYLIAIMPLTPETRGMIDGAVLDACTRQMLRELAAASAADQPLPKPVQSK